MFDKLLEVLSKSDKIGFALVFAAGGIFLGRHFWPQHFSVLSNDMLGWIMFAGLLGTGLLIWNITAAIYKGFKLLGRRISKWRYDQNVLARLNTLMPLEAETLLWMLVNNKDRVPANLLEQPFEGMVRKGVLVKTDGSEFVQVLRLHQTILANRDKLYPPDNEQAQKLKGDHPPWQRGMRI